MEQRFSFTVLLLFILTACAPGLPAPSATASLTETPLPTVTQLPTPTAIPLATLSPSPDPYIPYTIDYLRSRAYGGGHIEFLEILEQNILFTRYLIRYPSDGLNIYGFANVPTDAGPHPVIIALDGYIDPAIYNTLDYTTHYADALAGAGYIVLHPNLRGFRAGVAAARTRSAPVATDVGKRRANHAARDRAPGPGGFAGREAQPPGGAPRPPPRAPPRGAPGTPSG